MTLSSMQATRILAAGVLAAGALLLALSAAGLTWMETILSLLRPGRTLSESLDTYYRQGQTVLGAAALAAGIAALLRPRIFADVTNWGLRMPRRRFLGGAFAAALATTLGVQWVLFENMPHVTDAVSHDFQARLLSRGHIFAPIPPCRDAFIQHHVIMTTDGKWFSKYTPGHPLLLAAGHLVGASFLPVALCHALLVLGLFSMVHRFYNEDTARWVSLLFVLSPMATLLGASFMSHTSFLLLAVTGTVALTRAYDALAAGKPAGTVWRWGLLAGLFWGWALIARPQDAVVGGLMVLSGIGLVYRGPWSQLWAVGFRTLPGLVPPVAILLLWNQMLYGTWLAIGYGFTQDQVVNRLYQGSYGLSDHFTFRDALRLTQYTFYRFDRAVLGWPLTLPFCLGAFWAYRLDRREMVCLVASAIHVGVYFFYDYFGLEYEARYYLNLTPFVLVLLVRSFQWMARPTSHWRPLAAGCLLVPLLAHSVFHFWPNHVWPQYAREYGEISSQPYTRARALLAERPEEDRLLILMEVTPERRFVYGGGFLHTDPWMGGRILFATFRPEQLECIRAAFPDHVLYVMDPIDFQVRPYDPEDA